jgi:hypothetical protein
MDSQMIKRRCDNPTCDTVLVIDPQNPPLTELTHWIALIFTSIVDGKPAPRMKQACRKTCAVNIVNLEEDAPATTELEPRKAEDKPNLAKLKAAAVATAVPMPHLIPPS